MMELLDYQAAYRCDVERVENSKKLAIKPNEDFERDEDFSAVTTSYKNLRRIMLTKKFETLYTENLNAEEADIKRIEKAVEKEETRKKQVRVAEPLNSKGVGETYEERSIIKMMKGPFYKMISKDGILVDDFSKCAQQDLIDVANTESPKIFVMGKPRSGKTTLSKMLAAKCNLVHVSVENWLTALMQKIKDHDPAEDEVEEGQEPKKWLTDLEEAIHKALLDGSGPTHEQSV